MPEDHVWFLGSDADNRYVLIKRLYDGNPCWVEPVSTLAKARQRLAELRAVSNGDAWLYRIYDLTEERDLEEGETSLA